MAELIYQDAVWVIRSDDPKESRVGWGSTGTKVRCHGNQFLTFDGL